MADLYKPDPPPNLEASSENMLLRYLAEQLDRISLALGKTLPQNLEVLTKEPTKKTPFMVVAADGIKWDPGSGRGVYYWDDAWISLRVVPTDEPPPDVDPPPPPPPPVVGTPRLLSSWETSVTEDGLWSLQAKASDRATLVSTARHGSRAVQLRTLSGDNNVASSGSWERCDLVLGGSQDAKLQGGSICRMYHEAPDEWWAHSFYLPTDFHVPASEQAYVLMDVHDNYGAHAGEVTRPHQANFHIELTNVGNLRLRQQGGDSSEAAWLANEYGRYQVELGAIQKGIWYDFVHYFRWRNDSNGIVRTWLRKGSEVSGALVYEHIGFPNLYIGLEGYLKLANYHGPYGVPSSVIHDRCVAGPDQASVAMFPLLDV